MPESQRLNKYLALQLGISRREADELITKGKVAIDGKPAELGARVTPDTVVSVKGKPVTTSVALQYILLNKPVGYVCSRKRQGDTPTIYELLPPELHALKPVGRLDKDSSGLLLLSNDGDFAFRMTHPKFKKVKVYEVELDRDLEPLHQQMISDFGVTLEDGKSQFIITKLEQPSRSETERSQKGGQGQTRYQITMSEGRNRQIRRTFAALGYTVTKLHRTNFGPYQLATLEPGKYQQTTAL